MDDKDLAAFARRNSFRQGNIMWVHDPSKDEQVVDRKKQTRTIKRYMPIPLGKDWRAIKANKKKENGEGEFVIDTTPSN